MNKKSVEWSVLSLLIYPDKFLTGDMHALLLLFNPKMMHDPSGQAMPRLKGGMQCTVGCHEIFISSVQIKSNKSHNSISSMLFVHMLNLMCVCHPSSFWNLILWCAYVASLTWGFQELCRSSAKFFQLLFDEALEWPLDSYGTGYSWALQSMPSANWIWQNNPLLERKPVFHVCRKGFRSYSYYKRATENIAQQTVILQRFLFYMLLLFLAEVWSAIRVWNTNIRRCQNIFCNQKPLKNQWGKGVSPNCCQVDCRSVLLQNPCWRNMYVYT